MVTNLPARPLVGVKLVIVGPPLAVVTVKSVELVPVPFGLVTVIFPVVAPFGTCAEMSVSELTMNDASAVPLNLTLVAPVKFVPWMSTAVPTGPLVGENDVTVGGFPLDVTVKLAALVPVPFGVVTLIVPVVAPFGTCAEMSVSELTMNDASAVPLNLTLVAPVKFVPWMSTAVPTGPLVGENDVTVGGFPLDVTVKLAALVPVPFGVVTLIVPVVAP